MTETRVVAKTIIVNSESKVLLLRRSASDSRRPLQWDIPGGHTDGDELAEEAAAREAHEEAGIILRERQLRLIYTDCTLVPEGLNVVWLFFIGYTDRPTVTLSTEHDQYRWVTIDEALELIEYERQNKVFAYVRDNDLLGPPDA
ncbi:MAG TPA: NUDIX domain-containing protein [Candidatus Saccharimonadales bacterium]|nr:NUDIX domain-containing protein [Candidatus Saccharimonadales bacterium]